MLFEAHPEIDIHEMSPLALAFAGMPCWNCWSASVWWKHPACSRVGCTAWQRIMYPAHAQNQELALIEPMLTEEEQNILRRGKNASKASVAKHATAQEYRASTGFECLLGWLHLRAGDRTRAV